MSRPVEDYIGLAIWAVRDIRYLPGADPDDLRQEAMLGLLEALRDHDPAQGSIEAFVILVVRRRVYDAVKAANRPARLLITDSIRVARDFDHSQLVDAVDTVPDPQADVLDLVIAREQLAAIRTVRLTRRERRAVIGQALGFSYGELGEEKSVDNALSRARVKLRSAA